MRKLASIRRIDALNPIEGADKIEVATIGGWKVVAQKGLYNVGDLAVYFEIDSWIPHELAPFLSKGKEPRTYEGVKGERLKTIRLRGQLSQGLLMPISVLDNYDLTDSSDNVTPNCLVEGDDVTELLNIKKWEKPVNAQLAGVVKGNFPTLIPKTDQERVQNLKKEIASAAEAGTQFEITEKLEGSSMTVYRIHEEFGVCSRNLDLKCDENNTLWKVAIRDNIEEKMKAVDEFWDFAIQGELVGPNIQGNIYKLDRHEFFVFDVYNIQSGEYLPPENRRSLIEHMGLKHVPVIDAKKVLDTDNIDELLTWAEGRSKLNLMQEREGIVLKETNGGMSFKIVSNSYLISEK